MPPHMYTSWDIKKKPKEIRGVANEQEHAAGERIWREDCVQLVLYYNNYNYHYNYHNYYWYIPHKRIMLFTRADYWDLLFTTVLFQGWLRKE